MRVFIIVSAVILALTGAIKFASATGEVRSLGLHDPILLLTNRQIFFVAGAIETALACYLVVPEKLPTSSGRGQS